MALNSETLYKSSFQDFETWREASWEELYRVYINHDPGMTLTYFTAMLT